jgi:hypothetical protein
MNERFLTREPDHILAVHADVVRLDDERLDTIDVPSRLDEHGAVDQRPVERVAVQNVGIARMP